ncbi:MAG: Fimbrial protein precursor [Syntrophus sp. PtaB.Bin001]|jgi:type IV fimbrial biogenesis protein FimT|nr:MAG: Fimbrial protein precursor [Syntrophus sp. PtaB.Bin001]
MKRYSAKGFTLVEMIIVIAIMAILAAVAAPNFQEYMIQRRLNGSARVIMSELMNARMQAVSQNNRVIVSLESNHSYRVVRDLNNNGVVDGGETGTLVDIHQDYPDVNFAPGVVGYNPIFNTNGTAVNGSIVLTNTSGNQVNVTITTAGRVKISS